VKYQATYSFNVRRFIKREIEAETPEEAERIARAEAWPSIDAETVRFQNMDGFADAAPVDAWLYVDELGGAVIVECGLEEPEA
jgi:hypothetical protein